MLKVKLHYFYYYIFFFLISASHLLYNEILSSTWLSECFPLLIWTLGCLKLILAFNLQIGAKKVKRYFQLACESEISINASCIVVEVEETGKCSGWWAGVENQIGGGWVLVLQLCEMESEGEGVWLWVWPQINTGWFY